MKKRLLLRWLQCRAAMLVTLLGASLGINAEDKFYISDFEIAAGETKQIMSENFTASNTKIVFINIG